MSMTISELELLYPTSDGKPMAENTEQFEWIVKLQGGLDAYYADDPDVFVAGDLLWYPVAGQPKTRQAPDAMVVFGRPKGRRGSYMQWLENDIAPQVVIEVLSPGNRAKEMRKKLQFYQLHGVEEYYIYKPKDPAGMKAYRRRGSTLQAVKVKNGMRSPRLGMSFDLSGVELVVRKPDGEPLLTYLEQDAQRQAALAEVQREREQAQFEREQTRLAREESERERQRAEAAEQELAELRRLLAQRDNDKPLQSEE